jgi:cytochrome c556
MKTFVKAIVPALGAAAIATAAFAQDDLPAPVKARKAHMQLYGYNVGILANMARGNTEYDAEAATAAAESLTTLSGMNHERYWAPGTDNESLEGTKALPAIWDNLPDVIEKTEALHEASISLAGTAGDRIEALQGGLKQVGGACGDCHEDYRVSDN